MTHTAGVPVPVQKETSPFRGSRGSPAAAVVNATSPASTSARAVMSELHPNVDDPQTDVTGDDPIVTGKIALAHMNEFPDYYERLERMEREAERDWAEKQP
jgi:Protein of unknown function (DUF5661)